jgi:hypothetical protein
MKKINLEKHELARTLLKEHKTYKEIRIAIKERFNESIAPNTLAQLNKELKNTVIPIQTSHTTALKQFFSMFLELQQSRNLERDWDNAIRKHLDFDLMDKIREDLSI